LTQWREKELKIAEKWFSGKCLDRSSSSRTCLVIVGRRGWAGFAKGGRSESR